MALSNKFLVHVNCLPSEYFLQQSTLPHTLFGRKSKSGTLHMLQFGYCFGFISLYLGEVIFLQSHAQGFYEGVENVLQEIKNTGFYRLI